MQSRKTKAPEQWRNSQDFTPRYTHFFGHLLVCALLVEDPLHCGLHRRFPAEETLQSLVSILIRLPPLQALCCLKCERRFFRPENVRCKLVTTSTRANVHQTRVCERRNVGVIVMVLLDIWYGIQCFFHLFELELFSAFFLRIRCITNPGIKRTWKKCEKTYLTLRFFDRKTHTPYWHFEMHFLMFFFGMIKHKSTWKNIRRFTKTEIDYLKLQILQERIY